MIYNEQDLPNAPYSNPKKGVLQAWRTGQLNRYLFCALLVLNILKCL